MRGSTPMPRQRRDLHRELEHAAHHHADGQGIDRLDAERAKQRRSHQTAAISARFSSTGVAAGTAKRARC